MNKLQCIICKNHYNQPSMCPHCSEIFCYNCIKAYLSIHYFCPSCNNYIIDLISCGRLIDEAKQKIKSSQVNKLNKNIKKCDQHNMPLKYFCEQCKVQICSDCGLIQDQHKNHLIIPLKKQNSVSKTQIKENLVKIDQKILKLRTKTQQYNFETQLLKSQIKWCKNKVQQYYQYLLNKLQKQSSRLLQNLFQHSNQFKKELDNLKNVRQQMQVILDRNFQENQVQIQPKSKLFEYLQNNKQKQGLSYNNNNSVSQIVFSSDQLLLFDQKTKSLNILYSIYQYRRQQIYPSYHNFTYEFDFELNKDIEVIYSQSFSIFGYEFRLKLYPEGNDETKTFLSVFLELVDSPEALTTNTPRQYTYRLELLNLNKAQKSIIKQYTSTFSIGECWGYSDFIKLQDISQYIHQGKLIFVMGVKNLSYFDLSQNMKKYIMKISGQNKVLHQMLKNNHDDSIQHQLLQSQYNSSSEISSISDSQQFNL